MKLPNDVANKLYDHLNTYEDVHIEIIVRDCTKVIKAHKQTDTLDTDYWIGYNKATLDCEQAILARYRLDTFGDKNA